MSIDFEAFGPQLATLCREYGIADLSVFGSVARGEDGPDSDVDFLYVGDPAVDASWSDRWELKEKLEELLGRKVDLVPRDYLHWVIKDRVLADARSIYAA